MILYIIIKIQFLSEYMLRLPCFLLIFKFFIRSKVCDKNLISLLEWSVETILASNDTLVHFHVLTWWVSFTLVGPNFHYFAPHVFGVGIARDLKSRFRTMMNLIHKLSLINLSNF